MAAQEAPRAAVADGRRGIVVAGVIIVVGVLATTLAQPQALARLPLQNLLKNDLHVGPADNAAFFFWSALPWYFKPLAGILTDAFPLFGSRRKAYIVLSSTLAALGWVALALAPRTYDAMLWLCIALNAFLVVASTVVGGYMVEIAQASASSSRLTALRQLVYSLCAILSGPAAGYLATLAFAWTAFLCGGAMFLLAPTAILLLREQRRRVEPRALIANAGGQLRNIARAKSMWAAAGFSALFYAAPGFGTALFYRQQNELHMSTQTQGELALWAGLAGIAATFVYAWASRRLTMRGLLIGGLLAGTICNVGYLFYASVDAARAIETINGVGFTLAELALMDLAVRATPAGSEGLGFALMMSVRNLALSGTDWAGSALFERGAVGFDTLVLSNSAITLIAVPLVLLLPAAMLRQRDGAPADQSASKTAPAADSAAKAALASRPVASKADN